MSTQIIERPRLDDTPVDDMPPLNVIKCQCEESCPFSGPCAKEATDDDMLCDLCREVTELIRQFRSGIFSAKAMWQEIRSFSKHCHKCDPEFTEGNETDAPS